MKIFFEELYLHGKNTNVEIPQQRTVNEYMEIWDEYMEIWEGTAIKLNDTRHQ